MLYPQMNQYRTILDLSGIWDLKADPNDVGEPKGWMKGFDAGIFIAVPGSWNEQLAECGLMNYRGRVWYQKKITIPAELGQKKVYLRFGSADFSAKVWVNGKPAVTHQGGYLPFQTDITDLIQAESENTIIVSVDNCLTHDTIPQGLNENDFTVFNKQRELTYPATVFDFFACGIRMILIYTN